MNSHIPTEAATPPTTEPITIPASTPGLRATERSFSALAITELGKEAVELGNLVAVLVMSSESEDVASGNDIGVMMAPEDTAVSRGGFVVVEGNGSELLEGKDRVVMASGD